MFTVEPFAEDRLEEALGSPMALTHFAASTRLCVPKGISQGGAALGANVGPAWLTAALLENGLL